MPSISTAGDWYCTQCGVFTEDEGMFWLGGGKNVTVDILPVTFLPLPNVFCSNQCANDWYEKNGQRWFTAQPQNLPGGY